MISNLKGKHQISCSLVNHVSAFKTKSKLFQQQAGLDNCINSLVNVVKKLGYKYTSYIWILKSMIH